MHWAAVEDLLAELGWLPAEAELEYPRPILAGHHPQLVSSRDSPAQLSCWLLSDTRVLAAGRLAR